MRNIFFSLCVILLPAGNRLKAQEIRTIYPPAEPYEAFSDIGSDIGLAMTNFVAKDSKLKDAYIWIQRESCGIITAQIIRDERVLATGTIYGKTVGKQQISFPVDIYLEKGTTYYLRLLKGEPATVCGVVAKTAVDMEKIQGFDLLGPVTSDLAHELVFTKWEGDPPEDHVFK